VIINSAWTVYNLVILLVAASVAWETRQRRTQVRMDLRLPLMLVLPGGRQVGGVTSELSTRGAAVVLENRAQLERGSPVRFIFEGRRSYCEIPAVVAKSSRRAQHLYFPQLSLAEEQELVDALYSRPTAWLGWHQSRYSDEPLWSLLHIFWLGLRATLVVVPGLFTPRPAPVEPESRAEQRMREIAAAIAVLLLGLLMIPPQVQAQSESLAPSVVAQTPTFHEQYDLSALGIRTSISLRSAGASHQLFFDMPITKIVSVATLRLRYSTPAVLSPNESALNLVLNGTPVSSLTLAPGPDQQAEIILPTDLLTTENTVLLQLQGSCNACGRALSWINIDPASTLNLDGTKLALPNDLSLLPAPFFDRSAQRSWSLPVAFCEKPDSEMLEAAAAVSSWFGIFSDVRGMRFPVSIGEIPLGNAVVFVLRNSQLAANLALPSRTGPLLAMRDNPHDPYGKLLVIAGDRPHDLLQVARALAARQSFPAHSDVAYAPATLSHPAPGTYGAPRWLKTDGPALIGTYTSEERLKLQGAGSMDIYFRLPPDLYLRWRQSAPLRLVYTYEGVPLGTRAALGIRLNGESVSDIPLPPATSSSQRADIVELPTGKMHPYTNTLTIDFYFPNGHAPDHAPQYVAIHRDSSIDLQGIPHSVVLPRLELFADAGYPFTQWPDLSRTAVAMPNEPTAAECEELLDIAGFFGAQTGSPVTELKVTDPEHIENYRDNDLIVLGNADAQPLLSQWSSRLPVEFTSEGMRLNEQPTPSRVFHSQWPFRDSDRDRLGALLERRVPLDLVVQAFVSPYRGDRSVVALIPRDRNSADALAAMFMPASHQGPIYGGATISRAGQFQSFLVGTSAYRTGELDPVQQTAVFLFESYWLIPIFVVVLAFLIAMWLHLTTERVASRRLALGRA
jgi:cellulose synthase (UDP-forming)